METPSGTTHRTPTSEEPRAWDAIVSLLRDHAIRGEYPDELASLIAEFMPALVSSPGFRKYFQLWESKGVHVTPVHFYSPVPKIAELADDTWESERTMDGIEMNDAAQVALLMDWKRFQDEYNHLPLEPTSTAERFYLRNPMFGGMDALVLHCMIRHFKPRSVIEVGSGFSTRLFVEATQRNGPTDLLCIEPYPDPIVKGKLPVSLLEQRVQDVPVSVFERLGSGDFLFIDSSHTVKIGGDVNYLLLEVLPRLRPGVIVHLHDIYLPHELPKDWVIGELRFWSEQDLLQAFLTFNSRFEVVIANSYLRLRHEALLRDVFPRSDWLGGGSFWMRRVS